MLNLGCGDRTHPDWLNIDFSLRSWLRAVPLVSRFVGGPNPPRFLNHDLRRGIPCRDGTADVVYASHVLEHLEPEAAEQFVRQIHRVLRPGGTIRVVVPDLETAARRYLDSLDSWRRSQADSPDAELRYDWSVIWLIDQMVRTRSGGQMRTWLRKHHDSPYVAKLSGIFEEISPNQATPAQGVSRLLQFLAERRSAAGTGELHRWMYDDASLARLMQSTGFHEVRRMTAEESRVSGWSRYGLDLDANGHPHQPDSIWMEGIR